MYRRKQESLLLAKIYAYATLATGGIFAVIWLLCMIAPMI